MMTRRRDAHDALRRMEHAAADELSEHYVRTAVELQPIAKTWYELGCVIMDQNDFAGAWDPVIPTPPPRTRTRTKSESSP